MRTGSRVLTCTGAISFHYNSTMSAHEDSKTNLLTDFAFTKCYGAKSLHLPVKGLFCSYFLIHSCGQVPSVPGYVLKSKLQSCVT